MRSSQNYRKFGKKSTNALSTKLNAAQSRKQPNKSPSPLTNNQKQGRNNKRSKSPTSAIQRPKTPVDTNEATQQQRSSSRWKCIGASVIGVGHEGHSACQDYSLFAWLDSGELIIAVSDGAGSAKYAARGAQLACETVIHHLKQTVLRHHDTDESWQNEIRVGYQAAFNAIQQEAESNQTALSDYAATLLVVVCTQDTIVCGMVGDGAVVALGNNGALNYVLLPQRGEYANESYFLTSRAGSQKLEISVQPAQVQAIALLTDGLLRISGNYKARRPHIGFFTSVFNFACSVEDPQTGLIELQEFLKSKRVNQYTEDDKTLVLVVDTQLSEVAVYDESVRRE
jgi:hypothetical protein